MLQDFLSGQLLSGITSKIAKQLGVSESVVTAVVAAGIPLLLGAIAKNASKPGGAKALNDTLAKNHDGSLLGDLGSLIGGGNSATDGGAILGHIFGSNKDTVVQQVADKSGVDAKTTGTVLEKVAPVVMQKLGQTKKTQGLDATTITDAIGGILGGASKGNPTASQGGGSGLLGSILGIAKNFFSKK